MTASGAVDVIACASRDLCRAQTWAAAHGIPTAYGSYEELLADPRVQGVYVPLPTGLRKEWVLKASRSCERSVDTHGVLYDPPSPTIGRCFWEARTLRKAVCVVVTGSSRNDGGVRGIACCIHGWGDVYAQLQA